MNSWQLPTMVVDDESGQSVLEFLLMLPMLVALTVITVKVNMAIQSSIVNQQYARAQAHWLTFNSAFYPERIFTQTELIDKGYNQVVIGISENPAPMRSGDNYTPKASTQMVTRNRQQARLGSNEAQSEPNRRGIVRIRNTVTLCAPSAYLVISGNRKPLTPENYTLAGNSLTAKQFEYCKGPIYE